MAPSNHSRDERNNLPRDAPFGASFGQGGMFLEDFDGAGDQVLSPYQCFLLPIVDGNRCPVNGIAVAGCDRPYAGFLDVDDVVRADHLLVAPDLENGTDRFFGLFLDKTDMADGRIMKIPERCNLRRFRCRRPVFRFRGTRAVSA